MSIILRDVILSGSLGIIIHVLIKARDLKTSSTKHNIEFKFSDYFLGDWLSHAISITVMALYILFINRRVHTAPDDFYEALLFASATVGYSGDHLASKFFSAATKRMEAAIDYKTSLADKAAGTTENPTPK